MNIVIEKSVMDSGAVDLDKVITVIMQRASNVLLDLRFPKINNECILDDSTLGRFGKIVN